MEGWGMGRAWTLACIDAVTGCLGALGSSHLSTCLHMLRALKCYGFDCLSAYWPFPALDSWPELHYPAPQVSFFTHSDPVGVILCLPSNQTDLRK